MTNALGQSVLERIGKTPLVRLEKLSASLKGVQILAKIEFANPSGSSKDRSAAAIVNDVRRRGLLRDDKRLLDASSGNAGVSYAMLGAALGFPVTVCMPEDTSPQQKSTVAAYGAEAVYTPSSLGLDGAIFRARELVGDEPARYCYVDQFSNDVNWQAHYESTGAEIWQQTQGKVTHFLAGVGSSGTFIGTTRKLKEHNSQLECIALQPDAPLHDLVGLKHISTTMLPAIYSPYLADRNVTVGGKEAHAMAKRLAREEGLLVGISSAAAVAACMEIGQELSAQAGSAGREAVIVTLLCDGADRYPGES